MGLAPTKILERFLPMDCSNYQIYNSQLPYHDYDSSRAYIRLHITSIYFLSRRNFLDGDNRIASICHTNMGLLYLILSRIHFPMGKYRHSCVLI
jgi:hypothetical protein